MKAHIKQGIILHQKSLAIGVPKATAGITRFRCVVTGCSNHAGTTPMLDRRDARYETMKHLSAWMDLMREEPTMVCNVGYMNVEPGHICVVPAKTEFTVEIRAISSEDVARASERLRRCLGEIKFCGVEISLTIEKPAAQLDCSICDTAYECSVERGYSTLRMVSGASHDASPISHVMPAGMIFVPSIDGISHAKEEATAQPDLLAGVQLLLDTILALGEKLE